VAAVEPAQIANEATDARKKHKLGDFEDAASINDIVASKPSTFAINKIRDMKYIELYCFTPAGCRDHVGQKLSESTADEAFGFTYGISADGSASNSLTLKPVSALAHLGKIIPDENLTWEQVRDAKTVYLRHIMEAGWNQAHVNALITFFIELDGHTYNSTAEGKQALVWYQAHAREDWHQKLSTSESFNLARLSKTLLADFKIKANDLSTQNNISLHFPTLSPIQLANFRFTLSPHSLPRPTVFHTTPPLCITHCTISPPIIVPHARHLPSLLAHHALHPCTPFPPYPTGGSPHTPLHSTGITPPLIRSHAPAHHASLIMLTPQCHLLHTSTHPPTS